MSYQSSQSNKNWGGTGSAGGNYTYRSGASPTGNAQGNWNTGGNVTGGGNQNTYRTTDARAASGNMSTMDNMIAASQAKKAKQAAKAAKTSGGRNSYPGTAGPIDRYIEQVNIPQAPNLPPEIQAVVAALARRTVPSAPVMSTYGPRAWDNEGQYGANNPASGFSLANFNNRGTWGGAQQTNIAKNPNGGGYTNINKNGGGGGYQFSYGGPR